MKISILVYLLIPISIIASCPNCKNCQQGINRCNTCNDGFYEYDGFCYECNPGCTCTFSLVINKCRDCQDGFFITRHTFKIDTCTPCMASCRSCTDDSSCSACKLGFYGKRCEKPCSPGCTNQCNMVGQCRCKPNFTGSLCETCIDGFHGEICSQRCSPNCSACSDENSCTLCRRGYYGHTCELPCSSNCANNECNKQSGICSSCINGYTGYYCKQQCSTGCLNDACDQINEKCTHKCKNGFHGDKCEYSCPPHCQLCTSMNNCFKGIFSRFGPFKCEDGFHGNTCEYSCPPNCQLCNNVDKCSKCKEGFYGSICEDNCPEECSSCNDGRKCLSCKETYSNVNKQCQCTIRLCASSPCNTCNNTTFYQNGNECCPCSRNCKHALCSSEMQCTHGCEDGYYGAGCELECTSKDPICTACIGETKTTVTCLHCKSGSYSGTNGTCSPCLTACWAGKCNSSDYCQFGCQEGYWDRKCNRKCKDNCSACDQITGACLRCLSARYYGVDCHTPCKNNCVNMSCHLNGTCTSGCNGDYYGSSCVTPCSDHCARFENEYACSSETGKCMFGCAEGFTGSMCMQVITQGSDGGNMLPAALGAGCAAFVIIAIVVVVGVFVHIRGRSPMYDTVQRANQANLPEELTYAALQANDSVRPTDVCAHSPVCGEMNAEYQNTDNEQHTYEIAS